MPKDFTSATNYDQRTADRINDLTLAAEYIMCAVRALNTGGNSAEEDIQWAKSKLKDALDCPI